MTKERGRDNEWDIDYLDIEKELKKRQASSFLDLLNEGLSEEDVDDITQAMEDSDMDAVEYEDSLV